MDITFEVSVDVIAECVEKIEMIDAQHGYRSISFSLKVLAQQAQEYGNDYQYKVYDCLCRAMSFELEPSSINTPYKPFYINYANGLNTGFPEEFSQQEIQILENILDLVKLPLISARVADLLWLLIKKRNVQFAKKALDAYMVQSVNKEYWNIEGSKCWERAARLCLQINDKERLSLLSGVLIDAFFESVSEDPSFAFSIAYLVSNVGIDDAHILDIVNELYLAAKHQQGIESHELAKLIFQFLVTKYKQLKDDTKRVECLYLVAMCYESEADFFAQKNSFMAHNLYQKAIQSYIAIPNSSREHYAVNESVLGVRMKISQTAKIVVEDMMVVSSPVFDIKEIAVQSANFVSGYEQIEGALLVFSAICPGIKREELLKITQESLSRCLLSGLGGRTLFADDGRVIAKTPPVNYRVGLDAPENEKVLQSKLLANFVLQASSNVISVIIPALHRILLEHVVHKELLISACLQSSFVPEGRERLFGHALWLGFDFDFGAAVHMLCPQVENMIRMKLKSAGVPTTNISLEDVENENGLSSLMDQSLVVDILGQDLAFEIKAVFTEHEGFNLRNLTAHGLLDDGQANGVGSVYAWWLILKLVLNSIVSVPPKNLVDEE